MSIGQVHSMESEGNLSLGAISITAPIENIPKDSNINCSSPNGIGVPSDSMAILHRGPLIGRNIIITTAPSFCLASIFIRAWHLFSNLIIDRIDLESPSGPSLYAPVVKGLSQEVSNLLSRVRIPAGAPTVNYAKQFM